jgi:hypothetical protein
VTDAGPDSGISDAGIPDAGSPADSGTAPDAGPLGDGGGFNWGNNLKNSGDQLYTSAVAFAADDAYVGGTGGGLPYLFHWDGQRLNQLYWTTNDLTALWAAPSGALFGAEGSYALECLSDCGDAGSYNEVQVDPTALNHVTGFCGSSSAVYAVGSGGGLSGLLWERLAGQWTLLNADSGVAHFDGCWVDADGSLYAAGQPYLVHYAPNGSSWTLDGPDTSLLGGSLFQFHAVTRSGGRLYAVGDEQTVAVREVDGGWSLPVHGGISSGSLASVLSVAANEQYAGGQVCPTCGEAHGFQGSWALVADLPLINVYSLYAVDANTVFAAGQEKNASGGTQGAALFIGVR